MRNFVRRMHKTSQLANADLESMVRLGSPGGKRKKRKLVLYSKDGQTPKNNQSYSIAEHMRKFTRNWNSKTSHNTRQVSPRPSYRDRKRSEQQMTDRSLESQISPRGQPKGTENSDIPNPLIKITDFFAVNGKQGRKDELYTERIIDSMRSKD